MATNPPYRHGRTRIQRNRELSSQINEQKTSFESELNKSLREGKVPRKLSKFDKFTRQ